MSKLFKSKIALGFMVAALVVVGSFAKSAKAADCSITMTLKQGMSGAEVSCLQMNLGVSPATGYFGTITKGKVMAFQASKGLTADGVFGAKSRAAWMAMGAYNSGNSNAAGALCPNGMTLASNCMSAPSSAASVTLCPNGMTLASNCMSAPSSNSTVVTGGAGNISAVEVLSSVSNAKVGEGDMDHKVFAYTVEADNGSDLAINSVKLTFSNSGSGSSKLNRYAGKVSVWMGGTKVGSADVSSFSESSNVYSRTITLSGAVVKADKKESFYVSVDANANIDSTDLSNNTWTVTLASTRYSDGTGAILTDTTGSITKTFQFSSLATASDVELKVNLASTNPKAKTVKASTTTDTNNVELLKFTMKAQGSSMTIDQIPVTFTTSESDLDEVTSNVILKIGGNTYNETVTTSSSAVHTVLFDDLNLAVSKDSTIEGTVSADINDIETTYFDEGTTLLASIPSSSVTNVSDVYIDVEDMNGDQLVTGDRTGSATGEAMTFRSTGVNVVMGNPTLTTTAGAQGVYDQARFVIPVAVTSFGNTLYMGQTMQLVGTNSSVSSTNAFGFAFQKSSAPTTDVVSGVTYTATLSSSDAVLESSAFRVDDGSTKNFTLTVNIYGGNTAAEYRIALDHIKTFTDAGLSANASSSALLPAEQYRTGYQLITK